MHNKGRNVERDEHARDAAGADLEHAVSIFWHEEVDHPAQNHVDVGVDPERSEEDQEKLDREQGAGVLVFDGKGAGEVAAGFPEATHDEDHGEWFAVHEGLDNVAQGGESKKDDEGDGGAV